MLFTKLALVVVLFSLLVVVLAWLLTTLTRLSEDHYWENVKMQKNGDTKDDDTQETEG